MFNSVRKLLEPASAKVSAMFSLIAEDIYGDIDRIQGVFLW